MRIQISAGNNLVSALQLQKYSKKPCFSYFRLQTLGSCLGCCWGRRYR